ncbi:hypothetical protein TUM20985_32540 [Mycobacterium antarcticum]|uniref:DUF4333 domain-containing protein n=1 Tax=unclassified Mycolicibacterium TaxID=2636767 RepID=UPI0023842562|nr:MULTISPECIES: DUF4333 domain-containing protein [unclassified Mycolicibacterium]BDX32707.1 hypothetical protein TUM20985_32540 [Mycolicibacterium sp. TUM20985]GLP75915.1 hypothetical protein TUM20983_30250 [Mycolicibacterium sp. TUM20983]GLP83741.1 hypothetical protein TUM20984_51610 [Mycolicibacterium sp. TUM20984]
MMRTRGVRFGTALLVGVAVLGLAGCGKVIDADSAQQSVTDFVSQNTEFTPNDVKCPSGTDAKVGVEFDCTFTGPDGDYIAHLKITKVDGSAVLYDIETKLA